MGTTRYMISEQVMTLLKGGNHSAASSIKMPAIMQFVNQAVNKLLKTEFYTSHIAGEESTPNGLVTAHYEGIKVEKYNKTSRAQLPAFPVKLFMDTGLFQINKPGCMDDPFIPIPNGQLAMLRSEPLISDLLGQIGYQHIGLYAVFTKDLPALGIKTVDMQLVVMDISSYSDYEPLPFPADMEIDVVQATFELLTGQRPPDKKVDSSAEYKPAER